MSIILIDLKYIISQTQIDDLYNLQIPTLNSPL